MTDREERFQRALDKGHSAAWDQDWSKAASYYRQALDARPDNYKALTSLGLALLEMHEYEEALSFYARAAEIADDDPVPFEKKAVLHEQLGELNLAAKEAVQAAERYLARRDVSKAIENWTRAVICHPEHKRAHARLAIVYERLGQHEKAISEYLNVASLFQHEGKLEHARKAIQRSLEIAPEDQKLKRALKMLQDGTLLPKPARPSGGTGPLDEEEEEQAPQLEAPQEAEEQTSGSPIEQARKKALAFLAQVVFEDTDQEAEEDVNLSSIMNGSGRLLSGKRDHSRVMLHITQAIQLQTQGDFSQAAEEIKRAVEAGLDHPAAHFDLGYLYLETGRLQSALRSLENAVRHGDYALGARLLLGQAYQEKENWVEASKSYLEALKLADGSLVPEEQVGRLHDMYEPLIDSQDREADQEAQRKLCDNIENILLRPNWKEYLQDVREQFGSDLEDGEFVPLADLMLETQGNQLVDLLTTVQNLARQGYYGAAMEKAFYALEMAPAYLPLHIIIGDLLLKRGQVSAAVTKYISVAEVYSVQSKLDRAISMLERVVDLVPMDIKVRVHLIDLLVGHGQVERAIDEYMSLGDVYYSLAELSNSREAYSSALSLVDKYDKDESWQIRILHRLADIDTQRLDWDSALDIFKRVGSLRPGDEKASLNVIDLYYRLGREKDAQQEIQRYLRYLQGHDQAPKQVSFLKSLIEEMPRQIAPRRFLAQVYQGRGNEEKAIATLDALGEMLLEGGRQEQALAVIQEIVNLNPPNVGEYRQLLEQFQE
jgi:tetratricopeptide (TPR) repeat protein